MPTGCESRPVGGGQLTSPHPPANYGEPIELPSGRPPPESQRARWFPADYLPHSPRPPIGKESSFGRRKRRPARAALRRRSWESSHSRGGRGEIYSKRNFALWPPDLAVPADRAARRDDRGYLAAFDRLEPALLAGHARLGIHHHPHRARDKCQRVIPPRAAMKVGR